MAGREIKVQITNAVIEKADHNSFVVHYTCAWFVGEQLTTGCFREFEIKQVNVAGEQLRIGFK